MGLCPWYGLSPSTSSAKGRTRGRAPFSSLPFRRGVASPHIRRQSRVAGPRRPLHEGPRFWWLQNDAPASCSDLQAPRISNDSTLKVNFRSILSGRVRCWCWCRSRLRNPSNFRSCRSRRWNCSSHLSRFQFRCCPLSCHSSNCRFRLLNYQFRRRSNRRFRLHLRRLSCRFQCCCPFRFQCCCPCR